MLDSLKFTLIPPIGAWLIRLLRITMRVKTEGFEGLTKLYGQGQPVIYAFWHGRQLMMPVLYPGKIAAILISRHRDGEWVARILSRFGHVPVRGSTTRGGGAAFRQLVESGRSGLDLAVTPDGPKGPAQSVKDGVIRLAKATGHPIVPATFGCSKKKSSRAGTASWCRTRFVAASSSAESRSGFRLRPRRRNWRTHGRSLKPR